MLLAYGVHGRREKMSKKTEKKKKKKRRNAFISDTKVIYILGVGAKKQTKV